MASHAADAITAGHADVVLLAYGSTARADLRKGLRGASINWGARGPLQWEAPYGHTLIAKYAMAARRHMFQYGTTIEQLAEVAVSARFNATDNPEAYYRDPITVDDVMSGPMVADPFTKLHCCIRSDGGAAVVMVNGERAKDLRSQPVWVLGAAETTSHMLTSQWDDMTIGPAAVSGSLAFARAGVRPGDVDVAELYDAFTYMLLCTIEDLGFCPKGEGGGFVEAGSLRLGGALPTNTDGAACQRVIRVSAGYSSLWRRFASCAVNAGPAGAGREDRLCQRHRWLVLLKRHDDSRCRGAVVPRPPLDATCGDTRALLEAAAVVHGDREAYVEPGGRITFADWVGRARAVALQFAAAGSVRVTWSRCGCRRASTTQRVTRPRR
ncbi:putative propanoyl-CoA C-acyltransferase [Mycobacterium xenopi 3993]|nr:putative propanoyl-CoA C-acyltransferase [Mycobacterium xenopi 3993]